MRSDIPKWADMPLDTPIVTLSWHDVFLMAETKFGHVPTREEILGIWDTTVDRMSDNMGEYFSDMLEDILSLVVPEYQKSKPYSIHKKTAVELTSKKFCHQCQDVQETYWELAYCKKNPYGIAGNVAVHEHGNNGCCEDQYCQPESIPTPKETITEAYVKEHNIFEKCTKCHQYLESAGPHD